MDCGRGMTIMVGKTHDLTDIKIKNAVFIGESEDIVDSSDDCIDIYGYFIASSTFKGKLYPEVKLSKLPFEKHKSDSNWQIKTEMTNPKFINWKSEKRTCNFDKMQRIFAFNPYSPDIMPATKLNNPVFTEVKDEAVAYLRSPPQEWAVIEDCGEWPCTGPENALLKFNSATATGTLKPDITDIDSGTTFQIISDNEGASPYITNCTKKENWNAYL
jgi:hypothetical protein